MADDDPFKPIFVRTETDIRTSMDAVATAAGIDTREGVSLFWWMTQPMLIELARVWDALGVEVPSAAYVTEAWGDKLDKKAAEYGLERKPAVVAIGEVTFTGDNGTLIGMGAEVGIIQADPDIEPPSFITTASGVIAAGTLTLPIQAVDPGADGNVDAGAIELPPLGVSGADTVTNADPTDGGIDVEDDEDLRKRILVELAAGRGPGNIGDYVRWSLAEPGVGRVSVTPVWAGPGTVLVVVSDSTGNPVPLSAASLQTRLDPDPGQGKGVAPIDHTVTVETVTLKILTVVTNVTPKPGYTEAGLKPELIQAIQGYSDSLLPGEDVIYEHAKSTLFDVVGMLDIVSFTINGGTANIAVAATEVAQLDPAVTVT